MGAALCSPCQNPNHSIILTAQQENQKINLTIKGPLIQQNFYGALNTSMGNSLKKEVKKHKLRRVNSHASAISDNLDIK